MKAEGEGKVRRAHVFQQGTLAGELWEQEDGDWCFRYGDEYSGLPVALTLPVRKDPYQFATFPAVFEGLLPEGPQLEALLRKHKIDRHDFFRQLVMVGADLVGSLTVFDVNETNPS